MSLEKDEFARRKKELKQTREGLIREIVDGRAREYYSEWLLKGNLYEDFNPTLVLAVFPNIYGNHDLHVFPRVDGAESSFDYWKRAASLELPQRIRDLEASQYAPFGDINAVGQQILEDLTQKVLTPKWPSAMIVFSKPGEDQPESVYLFAPTLVPPSVVFRQITDLATQHIQRLN